ncbi:MAG TPA: cytochrome c1 [Gammaproteobacteria bacterium]|nr:cytochrome c1 [Gammaproteobacteria bacterium]
MRKTIFAVLIALMPVAVLAAEGGVHLEKANVDLNNKEALQRGAKFFVNYCMSCHSVKYMRYNRVGHDIGLTDKQVKDNLIFTGAKVRDTMDNAMPQAEAAKWFGNAPPDLTVVARSRGVDWLYTYLRTFYLDSSRPFGVNNLAFPNVGMPDVVWELQGWQKPVYKTITNADGEKEKVIDHLELVKQGKMTPVEYDQAVRDLVTFLDYMGEPIKLKRQHLGVWVLLFLAVLFVVTYLLKKEYWKDVH